MGARTLPVNGLLGSVHVADDGVHLCSLPAAPPRAARSKTSAAGCSGAREPATRKKRVGGDSREVLQIQPLPRGRVQIAGTIGDRPLAMGGQRFDTVGARVQKRHWRFINRWPIRRIYPPGRAKLTGASRISVGAGDGAIQHRAARRCRRSGRGGRSPPRQAGWRPAFRQAAVGVPVPAGSSRPSR